MDIFLIRHTESVKNVRNSFSSTDDKEPLTEKGHSQATQLVKKLTLLVENLRVKPKFIYSADSSRATSVAKLIAKELGSRVQTYDALRSIRTSLSGVSEVEAAKLDSEFIHHYHLYRAGLLNAYNIKRRKDYENLSGFESRVTKALDKILSVPNETAKIIVLHRSPITATLINISRNSMNYPRDFYGYVPLDLGYLSWIRKTENGEWKILHVNAQIQEIMTDKKLMYST